MHVAFGTIEKYLVPWSRPQVYQELRSMKSVKSVKRLDWRNHRDQERSRVDPGI